MLKAGLSIVAIAYNYANRYKKDPRRREAFAGLFGVLDLVFQ
jgi:hypothetical protein